MSGTVVAVCRAAGHDFAKQVREEITLLAGLGVADDAHSGVTVQHRSRVAVDPTAPNLRQVHLLPVELFDALRPDGFTVSPGQLGENVTTRGVDLLALGRGTRLRLGARAVVEVTGLRNPCRQIDGFTPGLLAAVVERNAAGRLVGRAGVMAVVLVGGVVRPGDDIAVEAPAGARIPLARV